MKSHVAKADIHAAGVSNAPIRWSLNTYNVCRPNLNNCICGGRGPSSSSITDSRTVSTKNAIQSDTWYATTVGSPDQMRLGMEFTAASCRKIPSRLVPAYGL